MKHHNTNNFPAAALVRGCPAILCNSTRPIRAYEACMTGVCCSRLDAAGSRLHDDKSGTERCMWRCMWRCICSCHPSAESGPRVSFRLSARPRHLTQIASCYPIHLESTASSWSNPRLELDILAAGILRAVVASPRLLVVLKVAPVDDY